MLALLAGREFLGMTLWFSATAATAALSTEFRLSTAQTAWLTMAVQGGFVAGTLVSALANLPDLLATRRLFAMGASWGRWRPRRSPGRRHRSRPSRFASRRAPRWPGSTPRA